MTNVDFVIPVYNEGENIIPVLESLRKSVQHSYCVLICYDRENDNTLDALRSYRPASGPVVRLVKNDGHGVHGAVLSGFRASTAPAVIVYPADDTFNAGIIRDMVKKFDEGNEIVSASRFMAGGCMKGCPWLKAMLVRMASFTLHHCAGLPLHDATTGLRLFSRKVLDEIEIESSQGFTYSIELLVKCHRLGWAVSEVPAQWFERTHGASRFRIVKWLPAYLRWYVYAYATTYLHRKVQAVSHEHRRS